MPTVLRLIAFRFYFYSHEPNEPPHIHVDRDEDTPVPASAPRDGWIPYCVGCALDLAIRRLADACLARAMHGEVIPHCYQGEHRRYDNRLAMFLLPYRDPLRYAATLNQMLYSGPPEAAGRGRR